MFKTNGFLLIAAAWFAIAQCFAHDAVAGEMKKGLEAEGITPTILYDGEGFANLSGGLRRGTTYLGDLSVQLAVDGRHLFSWDGGNLFLTGLWLHGGHPSSYSGDAQGLSNIAGPAGVELYEAWIQQNLFDNHLSVLAGLYDLNSEFYRLESAGLFLNSSFGIGPAFSQSGVEGPSIFPRTSWGARIALKPFSGLTFKLAVLDGVPWERPDGTFGAFLPGDGLLIVSEAAFLVRPNVVGELKNHRMRIGRLSHLPPYDTKLAVGAWHYTGSFYDLSARNAMGEPLLRRGSSGMYFIADHLIYENGEKRFSAFAQIGFGDAQVDRFGAYLGEGVVMTGVLPGASANELGLAVATAFNGSHYITSEKNRGKPVSKAETAIELTSLVQATNWLAVQPDVQYIISPGTGSSKNSFAAQLLFELSAG